MSFLLCSFALYLQSIALFLSLIVENTLDVKLRLGPVTPYGWQGVWCWRFVPVIKDEQVKLCLRLVMDRISLLFSRSPPGAEEPPFSVTLIRQSVSSPILFSGIFPGSRVY